MTSSLRADVEPGRSRMASCISNISELASFRTSLKRRSARRSLTAAIRASRTVAATPPSTAMRTSTVAATPSLCRETNFPARYFHESGRAVTGRPSKWRRMSSANCSTEG